MITTENCLDIWAAVLEVSIADAQRECKGPDERASAAWIASDSREKRSFLWVCDILGADPERIRRMCRG